ncbi:hypothetical protein BJV82DRAFT_95496 [Fennellomyces sp. T-0311]|nr:hypothetical protein BJV82DRAFT_95496 [Fennellomyces sp. T-0311]
MFLSINGLSNDSNASSAPVTSDTASVETAQTSSTVKSLAHSSTNLPPPMPYKTDSYYNMMPQWMDSRPSQQSLPSINNNDAVFRSQNCSPVPSAVAPACSSEDSYSMFSQAEYDYRSMGRTLAGQNVFSSPVYDGNTFLSHKTDIFGESAVTTTRYPNSPPSDKSYNLEDLPVPQQPSSVYESRQHDLESVGSPENSSDLAAAGKICNFQLIVGQFYSFWF